MKKNTFIDFIKKDYLLIILLTLSIISLLRSLIIPLRGDELTYFKIGEQILTGKYYLQDYPSTVTPIIPFLIAFFYTSFYPILGVVLMKILNIIFALLGLRFLYLFLKNQQLKQGIIFSILILTLVNSNSIAWFSSLYPESILLFSFWGFVYYYSKEINISNFKKMLFFFLILMMTRYLFAVLGLVVIYYFYRCFKVESLSLSQKKAIIFYSMLYLLPVLFWFKLVYQIEYHNLSEISYFDRFKEGRGILVNILSGLGLEQHPEAGRINGIPAFVSLFVPITGLRNFTISILLIGLFLLGYFKANKPRGIQLIFYSTILVMLGLIFAGTGFSRYWLVLLPCYYLGFYFVFKQLKFDDDLFFKISKFVAIVYVINELRLDYLIISEYL